MRLIPLVIFSLVASAPALATDAPSLDLSLPEAAPPHRNDPPGTYYGDTSGVPAPRAERIAPRRGRCPASPDGEATPVTGSVSTGVGYSSGLGNSRFGAASLNYCNEYTNGDGDERSINMRLDMGTYEGPMHGPAYRLGPYDADPGFGPAFGPGAIMRGPGGR